MYLKWKKRGKSKCGKYAATAHGALYLGEQIARSVWTEKEAREICQRHAWAVAAREAMNGACITLTTSLITGASRISHALTVDSSQVSRWKLGRALVPARHCLPIALMVDCLRAFHFAPENLRPDLEFYRDESNALRWRKRPAIEATEP